MNMKVISRSDLCIRAQCAASRHGIDRQLQVATIERVGVPDGGAPCLVIYYDQAVFCFVYAINNSAQPDRAILTFDDERRLALISKSSFEVFGPRGPLAVPFSLRVKQFHQLLLYLVLVEFPERTFANASRGEHPFEHFFSDLLDDCGGFKG